ncbi:MAG: bifunctional 3,4-dihydroxy-2-butanone 4-phosphate synthase/GTP cyclohydrolase II [Armatimonadetes bacterium CG2_30_59_28]|nr:bifunctional 3,4-dihydroxy-2-butanone-4-phosphate synthase/GTP cyclohydrolase II [Armatimonadota bacterium]OIO97911.1 MAG: bifunctional 3,4-dihydroxy-2-butanone 4-phosphate synthase/GTP cyclohydrolase II [Armatimonadetes bacterium CG2_30_59_28]PIU65970.1 MAG: bifunctional 3,4-dihydroxy-2-butanone-4-phosphate synthase/GTP cyclohydrolase II [Armatimonadetes bacterium CG07_land_8_20_14_0_80_59_28]PIX38547.1 MAG: bifunctional 3,4-dihydroxy-2-butanone-4-phosphate synthase/GTP cyclohydrolase II [Ar
MDNSFIAIQQAIKDIQAGKFIIVVDDEDRENEGDLVLAAEKVTPEAINFMVKHARGLVCVPLPGGRLEELGLRPMATDNTDPYRSDFFVSVDARARVTTGISAYDRATTIRTLIDPKSTAADLTHPGHIFPLRAKEGGVLVRAGHTEAAVDLASLAELYPGGVICEIMKDDGNMAHLQDLIEFAKKHGIRLVTIEELIRYRHQKEKLVHRVADAHLPTAFGQFRCYAYESNIDEEPYIALVMGEIDPEVPILVRVHSGCLTGDALFSLRCDCGDQLRSAMECIQQEGTGVLLYIHHHEGRGIGVLNKIHAYALQDRGSDTVEANEELGFPSDIRDYGLGAQVLTDLGVAKMRLMTNNPAKYAGLEGYGLQVVDRVPMETAPSPENIGYLKTKKEKMGHLLKI